jgi:hypothetical protein
MPVYSSLAMPVLIPAHRLILYFILKSYIYDAVLIMKTTHQMAGLFNSFRYIYHNNFPMYSFLTAYLI